jgi:pyruvate formate lyase activating enzyme
VRASTTGRIFNVQRYSLHDGPGIRTTVFLKGCPARCLWCHNPESQSFVPQVVVFETRCIACGTCLTVCPEGEARPTSPSCKACGACVEACPAGARWRVGREVHVGEVMDEVRRDRVFHEESGGGVTFSGGEPLAQPAFLKGLLEACRAEAVSAAVDTCGFGSREALLRLAPLVDLFLFDLKLLDDARHLELTGLPASPIVGNLKALASEHPRIWVRLPVVPGHTDREADVAAIASLVAGLPSVRQVNLLPFHSNGASKARRLGAGFPLAGLEPPTPERLEALGALFRREGVAVTVGG